ncbi:phage tail-collar fiber domain-containing protein [Enterobacter cloacae]|uniref:phage tail-collar fiber domain-containing protein n=1 Tax=Enterobacter cloacae TaxID=550 RepID=UPI0015969B56|nr:phage tail protein [Enterobacter cloacae]
MAEKYYSILTNRGKELEAQSSATGKPVIIKDFVVGDGNGQPVKPEPAQTKLVREVYHNAISALQVSPDQANQFIAQLVLAAGVGGFVVREVGLLTDAGELYSVANCAAIEKPENGVSVNLQYRLAVSETANIELKMATGDGLFLRIDKNLSEIAAKGQAAQKSAREVLEVVDATISHKGLVQLSSATNSTSEALGATPKAVKAAYDLADTANKAAKAANDNASSRLLKSSNLTDVPDKVKARDALELKTAATRDVTTSTYDTTAGRVLKVGDFGQGAASGLALLGSIFDITCAAKYSALGVGAGASATQGMPANSGNTRFSVEVDSIYTNQYWVTLRSSAQTYTGMVNTENKTATWTQYYTESNKPAASDVDAVSASQGGVFQRQVQFSQGLRLQNAEYLAGINYGSDAASFSGANLLLESWYGIGFYSNYPSSGELGITGYINVRTGRLEMKEQIIPGNYANFNARYQAKGNYTPAGQAYTKAESDGRFQSKGNYTPAGEAYTKAESNARFLQGWRLGAQANVTNNNGGAAYANAPNGAVVTGIAQRTDWTAANYRYAQYNLNGTWYNAGVV